MNAQLRVISGPFVGQTLLIDRAKYIVGREPDCHLRPDSEFISRHHCVLLLDEFTLRIRDLGSKNGTFVNGRRITGEVVLCHDDMLALGEMTMQVDLVAPKPSNYDINPALAGTDFFDGNTLPSNTPAITPASPVPLPVVPQSQQSESTDDGTNQMPHTGIVGG